MPYMLKLSSRIQITQMVSQLTFIFTFVLAILRRGAIAQAKGNNSEAADYYKDAVSLNESEPTPWLMLGLLDLSIGALRPSRTSIERILRKIDPNHIHALLLSGNDRIISARSVQQPKAEDTRKSHLKEAVKFFDKVLRLDKTNCFAANGLGCVFYEAGYTNEARDAFAAVREAKSSMTTAQINLGHVLVDLGQYQSAIAVVRNTH